MDISYVYRRSAIEHVRQNACRPVTLFRCLQTIPTQDAISNTMSAENKEKEMERIEKLEIQSHTRVAAAQAMSEEEFLDNEKSLKCKLDLRLTSMIVLILHPQLLGPCQYRLGSSGCYFSDSMWQNNIAASKIAGIEEDLKLTPTQFSTAVALLFVCTSLYRWYRERCG
jgi:hypothetical protein